MPLLDRLLRSAVTGALVLALGCSSGGGGGAAPGGGGAGGGVGDAAGDAGGADAKPALPLPPTADSGFRPRTDGFAFPNYADLPGPGVFDSAGLRRMFGDKVCTRISNGVCSLTPQGQDWVDKVNASLQGGHCEGFAVLSLLFYNKWIDAKKFGASATGQLVIEGNGALNHELAYWYATQFLEDPVITTTHSLGAVDAVSYLLEAFSDPSQDTIARIGLARIGPTGALEGGHAITPYAVLDGDKPGTKKIMVYDSNHPGDERFIDVDLGANRWSYVAGTTPQEADSLYTGDATNKNYLYLAAAHPRLGLHACPFCDGTPAKTALPVVSGSLPPGGPTLPTSPIHRNLLVQGDLDPLVVDADGKRVGRVDGAMINEIPGAIITPGFSGGLWTDNAPVQILLPPHGDFKVSVSPRARTAAAAGADAGAPAPAKKSSVTLFGGGFSLGVEYPAGATVMGDTIGMPGDAHGVTLTSIGPSSATLAMAVQTASGGMVAHIAVANLPAGANVGLQTDASSGKVGVSVDSPTPVDVTMNVGIDKGDGTGKQVFEGGVTSSGADSVGVDLGHWTGGTDPMPITVAPSDGSPPKVVVVDNTHDYTPPAVDECALGLSNCSVDAICTDSPSSFTCACKPGYGGDGVTCVLGAPAPVPVAPLAPSIAYTFPSAPSLLYTVGKLVALQPPANAGGTIDAYAVTPALPPGLTFDTGSGALSGTPLAVTAAADYVISATNVSGTSRATLSITVQGPAPHIAYAAGNQAFFRWDPAPVLTPTNSGGPALEYSITPALPSGLVFDVATGQISGTPTALSPETTYTVTASNRSGSWPCSVSISVVCAGGVGCGTPPGVLISGAVTGLVGSGLVLQDDGGDDLALAANGSFAFRSSVTPGAGYVVTVLTQPTLPVQTCTVTRGSGLAPLVDVTDVAVACTTRAFTVGGTITGLAGSATLQDDGGNDLTVSSSGAFTFSSPVLSGGSYAVTVLNQPASPVQTCTVSRGSGVVSGSNVTSVAIACATRSFTVGASVVGLVSSGLVLQNDGSDATTVDAGATAVAFPTPIASGGAYAVTIQSQPEGQTCAVSGGSGVIGNGNVSSVVVNCTLDTFTVGGTITGLAGTVVLQNEAGDNLTLNGAGAFAFPTPVASGSGYAVTVLNQPSLPSQTCTVTSGATGTVTYADVTSVVVTCTVNAYAVGGSATGLAGTLVLQDNAGDNLSLGGSGAFTFASPVPSGNGYAVTVLTQPSSPSQTCTVVSGASGTIGSGNVSSVSVVCTTNRYAVAGTVTGLNGSVILQNEGADDVMVSANGSFTFPTSVASGATYGATVLSQPAYPPAAQTCIVSAPSGSVGGADVTSIAVTCTTNVYTVGGTISGSTGAQTLQDNAGNDLVVSGNGSFTFSNPIASGLPYAVTVSAPPPGETCQVTSGSGTVASANVTDVAIACTGTNPSSNSCKSLLAANPGLPSGVYTLTGATPYQTYCDMTTDGGGWTLVLKLAAGDFCNDSPNWTSGLAQNEANMIDPSFPGVGMYDAKSSAFFLVNDATSLRFDTATGGSVTTTFVSPATAQNLMTTNDVPFAAYPNRADWKAAFGHDRDQAPIFMRAGVPVTDGNVCRTNPQATPTGCGKTCMFCYQASDGNCCGCDATANDTSSGVGNGAAYCGGGLWNCSTGGSWSNSQEQSLVWAR